MIDNLLYSGFKFNENEKFLKSRFKLLNSVLLITGFFTILFGFLSDIGINELGSIHTNVNYISGFLSFVWIALLRQSKNNYALVSYLLIITSFLTFTSALTFVPQDQFRIIWFYLLVYVAYFLLGKKIGFTVSMLSILVIVFLNNSIDLELSQTTINSAVLGLLIASLLSVSYINKITEYEKNLEEDKVKYHQLLAMSSEALFIIEPTTGKLLEYSEMAKKFLRYNDAELQDLSVMDWDKGISSMDEYASFVEQISEHPIVFERTHTRKDGSTYHASISAVKIKRDESEYIYTSVRDITQAKKLERNTLRHLDLLDHNIVSSSTDLDGKINAASEAFCKISGYSRSELIGQNHNLVRHPDMPAELYRDLWKTIKDNKTWKGEIKNRKKDGTYYWVFATIYPKYNDFQEVIGYTSIRQDITDKKLIEKISITDGLTGIYNRRHFNDLLPQKINAAKRKNDLVSFLIMDIDYFKQYNDIYGHQMGDDVLIKVAQSLKSSLQRADDCCFRLGGEEFGVLFNSDSKEQSIQFANQIRENIEKLQIEHAGNSASKYVTVSIGLICKNGNEIKNEEEIYKQGDDLLYQSKENMRNTVSINS